MLRKGRALLFFIENQEAPLFVKIKGLSYSLFINKGALFFRYEQIEELSFFIKGQKKFPIPYSQIGEVLYSLLENGGALLFIKT